MQTSIVCRLAFVAIWICAPNGCEVWGQENPPEAKPIEQSETGSKAAMSPTDESNDRVIELFKKQFEKGIQNRRKALPENNETIESISERNFRVELSRSTEPIDTTGREPHWIMLDPSSPGLGELKPGDHVNLLLPDDAAVEELDSDQTYIPAFKPVIDHVKVFDVQLRRSGRVLVGNILYQFRGTVLGVYLSPNEVRQIQSELSFEDLGRSSITHVVRLKHSRAEKMAERLQSSFKSAGIKADADQNAIVIEWNSSWPMQGLIDIENTIRKLDVARSRPVANVDRFSPVQPTDAEVNPTQNRSNPSGESAKANLTRAIPDTPAARNLVEQLRSQESAATALATEIRQYANGPADQNQPLIDALKRKLQNELETAFDLKLQLEEIQVKELQSRLSQHQQQIGQRKALRAKIIARRASDLVEGNALKWNLNSEAINGNKNAGRSDPQLSAPVRTPVTGGMNAMPRLAPASNDQGFADHKLTCIQMSGPENLMMSMGGQLYNIGSEPLNFGISRAMGDPLDLNFQYTPVLHAAVLAGRLDLYPPDTYSGKFLRNNYILIEITEEDIRAAWNNGLIKVVYLPDPVPGMPAPSAGETIVASSPDDVADPIQEAERLGTILLVLRLAKNQQELPFAKVYPGQVLGGPGSRGPDGRSQISNENTGLDASDRSKNVKPTQFPTPDEFRIQLEPFLKRLHTAKDEVWKWETIYFQDRSNAAELQTAIDEFTKAKDELRGQWTAIKPALDRCLSDIEISKAVHESLSKQQGELIEKLSTGKATEAEAKSVSDAMLRAKESVRTNESRIENYLKPIEDDHLNFISGSSDKPIEDHPLANFPEVSFPTDAAMIWIETATGLKLQFVRCDDLKLPFKAALRVRESKGQYKTGDLIVVLHNRLFESLDQVVTLLLPGMNSHDSIVLKGGLAGTKTDVGFVHQVGYQNLQPASIEQTGVYFELRLKGPEQKDVLIEYLNGTCVSPDGLVVVPVSSKSLVEGEPIRAFGDTFKKATARVVASDDERGLTLLKLELAQRKLVPWLKCRTGQPAMGQHLTGLEISFDSSSSGLSTMNCSVTVMELDQKYARQRAGNDGFIITAQPAFSARMGSPLTAIDDELQGIVVDREFEEPTDSSTGKPPKRITAIPSIHIQKLVDEYRKQESKH